MPEYPDRFEMRPGDTATIELKYNEPKTGVIKSGHNEGDAWILYSVRVNNDGEWRSWFTSPGSTAYDAHKMIQERNYRPGISIDIELTADSKWIIRTETWDDIFGEQKQDSPDPEHGAHKTPLEELEGRMITFSQAVNERLGGLEVSNKLLLKEIEALQKHTKFVPF